MKRIVLCFLAVFVCLSGCAKLPEAVRHAAIPSSFEMVARFQVQELEGTVKLRRLGPGQASVSFESPPAVKGLSLSFEAGLVTFRYQGLSFQMSAGSLPAGAAAQGILGAIDTALREDVQEQDGAAPGTFQIEGLAGGEAFILTADASSGNILNLSVPGQNLHMEVLQFINLS